ncbi:hypothetical protein FHX51_001225 [Aeriscardovia aeriphila]|uniref:Uncharacterized protein n=1 Tax=Aeriscardovia aeriphila TaxID=218139 RepID=A0A261FCF4_9BIFI|nr:hypothetical protein [Aeriscardovia aeriphila]OZG56822.1 hypothetical protein AEAE_0131 [Aeriscardovia aeriphila]
MEQCSIHNTIVAAVSFVFFFNPPNVITFA